MYIEKYITYRQDILYVNMTSCLCCSPSEYIRSHTF